jgi:hypothetical protein
LEGVPRIGRKACGGDAAARRARGRTPPVRFLPLGCTFP